MYVTNNIFKWFTKNTFGTIYNNYVIHCSMFKKNCY